MNESKRSTHPRGWVKLYKFLPTNPKIIGLKDAEFRAYIYALAKSEDEQIRGRYLDRTYLAAAIGKGYAKHIDRLLKVGLLTEYDDGMIGIHQFEYWNHPDTTTTQRQARWYENNKRQAAGLPRLYADGRMAPAPSVANALGTHRQDETHETEHTDATRVGACVRCFQPIRLGDRTRAGNMGDVHEDCPR